MALEPLGAAGEHVATGQVLHVAEGAELAEIGRYLGRLPKIRVERLALGAAAGEAWLEVWRRIFALGGEGISSRGQGVAGRARAGGHFG